MTENGNKTILEKFMSVSIDGSKDLTEEMPHWIRPIARVPIFFLIVLMAIVLAPIGFFFSLFRKSTINPFFKLRTELETKWYYGKKNEALSELRKIKETLYKNQERLFFRGVHIPQYGKFKFDEFTKILWLLYNWEFHSGNFLEASEVCDYVVEQYAPENSKDKSPSNYWEEWVLKKAKAIHKMDGNIAAQEYLLKFINSKNKDSRINKYLYEIREESKEAV